MPARAPPRRSAAEAGRSRGRCSTFVLRTGLRTRARPAQKNAPSRSVSRRSCTSGRSARPRPGGRAAPVASGLAFILAFAGGAILTMLADTMMPEAFEYEGKLVGNAFGPPVARRPQRLIRPRKDKSARPKKRGPSSRRAIATTSPPRVSSPSGARSKLTLLFMAKSNESR